MCIRDSPQTPLLKGRDAVANATSGSGTMVLAVAFIVIGCNCFAYPASVAASYGIPLPDSTVWIHLLGVRNITIGILVLAMHMSIRAGLRVLVPCLTVVPAGDYFVLSTHGASGFGHLAAAVCMLMLSVALHLDPLLRGAGRRSYYNRQPSPVSIGRPVLEDV